MRNFKHIQRDRALYWRNWLLAVAALLLAGAVYRLAASRLKAIIANPITLPVPLSEFPVRVNGWIGTDVPLSESIQRVARNDDFFNRLYTNAPNDQQVNVYVAYSARPRTMLGHRPQVCYVAGGWVHDSTEESQVVSSGGRAIPCLIHRFHMPGVEGKEAVVLNFYIVNGLITTDESVFTGLGWRTPNIAGNPARYVAQVQVSSVLENSVRSASKGMADLILGFFPDENGEVKATELRDTLRAVLK
jgi:hypothetical protein